MQVPIVALVPQILDFLIARVLTFITSVISDGGEHLSNLKVNENMPNNNYANNLAI